MGEDALQRFIAELLRPLVAAWLTSVGRQTFVGADQFLYWVEGDPKTRVAPDVYVLPGVDPAAAPPCWKLWELPHPPSFALEIVSRESRKDYKRAPERYRSLGARELVIFDPKVTPRSRVRVRWQVYRRVGRRGWNLVEKSNEDRVYARELGCWLRVVGDGSSARLRVATGARGDTLIPTPEETAAAAMRIATEAAQQAAEATQQAAEATQQAAEAARREADARAEVERLRAMLRDRGM